MNIIPLFEAELGPMDKETTKYLIQCTMLEKRNDPKVNAELINNLLPDFGYRVLKQRLDIVECKCSPALLVFILSLCENPAKLVQWVFTLHCIQKIDNVEQLTIGHIVMKYFMFGFPIDLEYQRLWSEQKKAGEPHNNGIDNFDNWPAAVEAAKARRETKINAKV